MKAPFILITYGFTQRLFTFEQAGVHKLPVFQEPVLAALFKQSAVDAMEEFLNGKEELQVQICSKTQHAIDMFKMVAIVSPGVTIVYNAAPLGDDPEEAIRRVSSRFKSMATVINREYDLDGWLEELDNPNPPQTS